MTDRARARLAPLALALALLPLLAPAAAQAGWLDRLIGGDDSAAAVLKVVQDTCVTPMAAGQPPMLPDAPGADDLADEQTRARLAEGAMLGADQPILTSANPHVFFAGPRVDDFCVALIEGIADDQNLAQAFQTFTGEMSETHAPGRLMISDARRNVILTKAGPLAFYPLPAPANFEPAAAMWAIELNPKDVPASCFDQQTQGAVTCGQE